MTSTRVLVPVSESATLRNTVAHAVRATREAAEAAGSSAEIHFVYPVSSRLVEDGHDEEGRALLERVAAWAGEDLGDDPGAVTVETARIGTDVYLFSPADYARAIVRYLRAQGLGLVLLDPGYNPAGTTPLLPPLAAEIRQAGVEVQEAPVTRERRRIRLVRRATADQLVALFGVSFAFYLLLAASLDAYELVTGAITAGAVAFALWHVSFTGPVRPVRRTRQLVRLLVYIPYLLWEITKANLEIAYVVLHPDLPIDPEIVEFDAAVWSPLPATTLANSITLTPGTLTVDVTHRHFTVHTLTKGSRESLLDGGLERAVRFVFYGRSAARIASPAERQAHRSSAESGDGGDSA